MSHVRPVCILLLMGLAVVVRAQYVSRLGRFQVDEKKGCIPFTVTVTNLEPGKCTPGDPCDMDFEGDNQFQQQVFTHTYTQAGTYLLTIVYQTIGQDDITIQATPNVQPTFESYGCSGDQVKVKVTDTNYNQYVIDFNDGSPVTVVPSGTLAQATHAYGSSGSKSITVRGRFLNAADNCNSTTLPFTARATLPAPTINTLTVSGKTDLALAFTNANDILYRLEISANGTGPFQQLQQVYNSNTAVATNLNTESNHYCFRLGAVDACAGTTQYSNIICSLDFDLAINSGVNDLTWTTAGSGINFFSIKRNSNTYTAVTSTSFSDTDVTCGTDYCYQVETFYNNGSKSISAQKCGTAFSSEQPTPIDNTTVSVTDEGASLTWVPNATFPADHYSIFRGKPGGASSLLENTQTPTYTDTGYDANDPSCYRIRYTDKCENASLSGVEVCPIMLSGQLEGDNTINLNWTDYEGWAAGVNMYSAEKYDADGNLLHTFNAGNNTTLTDDVEDLTHQVFIYVVKAQPKTASLGVAISNKIIIIKEARIFYPRAFTPDHTGPQENERFRVFGEYIDKFEMKIFNRWGELLYVATDPTQGWDGTYEGIAQPEGTYVFRARITDLAGRTVTESGPLLLLRMAK